MKGSAYLAAGIFIAIVLWMLSGSNEDSVNTSVVKAKTAKPFMSVSVKTFSAININSEVVIQGQLEPLRKIILRAETGGLVVSLPVEKGQRVTTNEVLVILDQEDRPEQLAQMEAAVSSDKLKVTAAIKLNNQRLQTEQYLKSVEADLTRSEAELARILLDIKRTKIRAPYAGVLETRYVEQGSMLQHGDAVGELVDDSSLLAVGQVSQQDVGKLKLGQTVEVELLNGNTRAGVITYLSRVAEAGTRSFKVEVRIDNSDVSLHAGASAELRILVDSKLAHYLSPSVLTLDTSGQMGVKILTNGNQVVFQPVKVLKTRSDGIWLEGLPLSVTIITQGQGFVADGEMVNPVPEGSESL